MGRARRKTRMSRLPKSTPTQLQHNIWCIIRWYNSSDQYKATIDLGLGTGSKRSEYARILAGQDNENVPLTPADWLSVMRRDDVGLELEPEPESELELFPNAGFIPQMDPQMRKY